MPRATTSSKQLSIPMIVILFGISIFGIFLLAAGFTFGIGGLFWGSLGVIGVIVTLIILFLFIGLPILAAVLLAQAGAKAAQGR